MRFAIVIISFVGILALVSLVTLAIFVEVPSAGPLLLGAPQQLWSPTSDVIAAVIGIPTALAGSIVAIYLAYHALRVSGRQGDLMAMEVIHSEIRIVKDDVSNAEYHIISLARAALRYASSIRDFVEAKALVGERDGSSVSVLVDEVNRAIKTQLVVDDEVGSAYSDFKKKWDECLHRSAELAVRDAFSREEAPTTPAEYDQLEIDREELASLNRFLNELATDFAAKINLSAGTHEEFIRRIEELLKREKDNWLRDLRSQVDRLEVEKAEVCSAEKGFHEAIDNLVEFLLSRSRSQIFREIVADNLSSEVFRSRFEDVLKSAAVGERITIAHTERDEEAIAIDQINGEEVGSKFDRGNLLDVLAKCKASCSGPAIIDSFYEGRLFQQDLLWEEVEASWHIFNRNQFFARSLPEASRWLPRPGAIRAKEISRDLNKARDTLTNAGIPFPAVIDVPYADLNVASCRLGESEVTIGGVVSENRPSSDDVTGRARELASRMASYPDHVKCEAEKALGAINSSSFLDVFFLLAALCDPATVRDRVLEYCKRFDLSQDLLGVILVNFSESGIRGQLDFPLVLGMALGFSDSKGDIGLEENASEGKCGRRDTFYLEAVAVASDGAAGRAGLKVGDVILGIVQGADTHCFSDYSALLREVRCAKEQGKKKLKLRIRRRSDSKTLSKEDEVQLVI